MRGAGARNETNPRQILVASLLAGLYPRSFSPLERNRDLFVTLVSLVPSSNHGESEHGEEKDWEENLAAVIRSFSGLGTAAADPAASEAC